MADYSNSDSVLSVTERAVTILVCAVLAVAVAVSCSSDKTEARRGLTRGTFDADSFLPGSLPGIALQKMSVRKTETEIEQYMGSRAFDYYDYRLVGLTAALYDSDSARLSVEIAQFAGALDAYGFYSLTRPDGVEVTRLGAEGYMEGHSFYFVNGPYAVTISAITDFEGVSDLMVRLGVSISAKIGLDTRLPDEFSVFPDDGRVPASYRYFPFDYLSESGLDSVLTCRYEIDSVRCTLFCTGDRGGRKYLILSRHADSLGRSSVASQQFGFDEQYGFVYTEPSDGQVVAGLVAGRLVGVIGYDSTRHEALLVKWVESLRAQ